MLEIEMKFPVADFGPIVRQLSAWQARPTAPLDEADHYYNAPDRDFGRTDEAFRLRRVGSANRITYKGPKQPGPAKTRTEIEVGLAEGHDAAERFCQLVEHLGYRPTAIVRKRRHAYHLEREGFAVEVCLDEVEQVGRFVEVEVIAQPEQKARAEQMLLAISRELGLERSERRSYLEMLLSQHG